MAEIVVMAVVKWVKRLGKCEGFGRGGGEDDDGRPREAEILVSMAET